MAHKVIPFHKELKSGKKQLWINSTYWKFVKYLNHAA